MITKTSKLEKSMNYEIKKAINDGVCRNEVINLFKEYSLLIENRINRKKEYNQQAFGALRNLIIDYWI